MIDLIGIYIPGYIANRDDLTRTEKYIFGIINGLAQKEGYCFASNYYLAQKAGCSEKTVSRAVSKLKSLGFIDVQITMYSKDDEVELKEVGTKRKITPYKLPEEMSTPLVTGVHPPRTSMSTPLPTNVQHSKEESKEESKENKEKGKMSTPSLEKKQTTGNSVGLQLNDTISDSRLAYLKSLAYKKDLKSLRSELNKSMGSERAFIKNELIPFVKGKKPRFEQPEFNQVSEPSVTITRPTDEDFRRLYIKTGVKEKYLREQWETYLNWCRVHDLKVDFPFFTTSNFIKSLDPFSNPKVEAYKLNLARRNEFTSVSLIDGYSRDRARKEYYWEMKERGEITREEYVNYCVEERLITALEIKLAGEMGIEVPDVKPFYWAKEEYFYSAYEEDKKPKSKVVYDFYHLDDYKKDPNLLPVKYYYIKKGWLKDENK